MYHWNTLYIHAYNVVYTLFYTDIKLKEIFLLRFHIICQQKEGKINGAALHGRRRRHRRCLAALAPVTTSTGLRQIVDVISKSVHNAFGYSTIYTYIPVKICT